MSMPELAIADPSYIEDDRGTEAVLGLIPLFSGNHRKAQYLAWRAVGLSVRESCSQVEIDQRTVQKWRRDDEEFQDWETNKLQDLQKTVAPDLLRNEFMLNMRLVMKTDFKTLFKAAAHLSTLTEDEMRWARDAAKRYTPSNMADMERALSPDIDGSGKTTAIATVIVQIDGKTLDSQIARNAVARSVLDNFRETKQLVGEVIDSNSDQTESTE